MAIDMTQFFQVFFEESAEHLETLEKLLLGLDIDRPDVEQVNAIFRAVHSIKGSAATFGFTDLAAVTHVLEGLLDRVRRGELSLTKDMVDSILAGGDLLRAMLAAHQGGNTVSTDAVEAICERLRLYADTPDCQGIPVAMVTEGASAAQFTTYDIQFVPSAASVHAGGVKNLVDDLRKLGELEIIQQPDPASALIGTWCLRLTTAVPLVEVSEQIDFVAEDGNWLVAPSGSSLSGGSFGFFEDAPGAPDEAEGYGFFEPLVPEGTAEEPYGFFVPMQQLFAEIPAKDALVVAEEGEGYGFFEPIRMPSAILPVVAELPAAPRAKQPGVGPRKLSNGASAESIRVGVEKVDQLINLVGELVITQSMLLQSVSQMDVSASERLLDGLLQLERNTRDLQDSVLSIRMMPISIVFSRFPRVVRDLSAKLGKRVELKTSGETTELDKGLVERIADPLTHLVRNSMDHGIESPERRVALGKNPVGVITLKASHQGGSVVVEVGDDGAGLSREKILAKARERGLAVSEQMSDGEVFSLIFEPGFSTADQVTDVSGRGVGMDVVRRNIQELGGRVDIESIEGIGTRVTVRLPLTLAILDGMSVAVGGETYIMPLTQVVESFQPRRGDVRTVSNQGKIIQVREEYLPVVALHEFFNLKSQWEDFSEGIVVVVAANGSKAALFVDALLGQHQVVIKSLEANYRRVPGVSGATIMGDGRVALILDLPAIAGMASSNELGRIGTREERGECRQ